MNGHEGLAAVASNYADAKAAYDGLDDAIKCPTALASMLPTMDVRAAADQVRQYVLRGACSQEDLVNTVLQLKSGRSKAVAAVVRCFSPASGETPSPGTLSPDCAISLLGTVSGLDVVRRLYDLISPHASTRNISDHGLDSLRFMLKAKPKARSLAAAGLLLRVPAVPLDDADDAARLLSYRLSLETATSPGMFYLQQATAVAVSSEQASPSWGLLSFPDPTTGEVPFYEYPSDTKDAKFLRHVVDSVLCSIRQWGPDDSTVGHQVWDSRVTGHWRYLNQIAALAEYLPQSWVVSRHLMAYYSAERIDALSAYEMPDLRPAGALKMLGSLTAILASAASCPPVLRAHADARKSPAPVYTETLTALAAMCDPSEILPNSQLQNDIQAASQLWSQATLESCRWYGMNELDGSTSPVAAHTASLASVTPSNLWSAIMAGIQSLLPAHTSNSRDVCRRYPHLLEKLVFFRDQILGRKTNPSEAACNLEAMSEWRARIVVDEMHKGSARSTQRWIPGLSDMQVLGVVAAARRPDRVLDDLTMAMLKEAFQYSSDRTFRDLAAVAYSQLEEVASEAGVDVQTLFAAADQCALPSNMPVRRHTDAAVHLLGSAAA